jgi:hypothetical protein
MDLKISHLLTISGVSWGVTLCVLSEGNVTPITSLLLLLWLLLLLLLLLIANSCRQTANFNFNFSPISTHFRDYARNFQHGETQHVLCMILFKGWISTDISINQRILFCNCGPRMWALMFIRAENCLSSCALLAGMFKIKLQILMLLLILQSECDEIFH